MIGLYDFFAAIGLHFKASSLNEVHCTFSISIYYISEIQLFVKLRDYKRVLLSRPSIFLIKLWLRSSLFNAFASDIPSIYSISLNDSINVLRLTSFSRHRMDLIRLEKRLR